MARKPAKSKAQRPSTTEVSVILSTAGLEYKATGHTIVEALGKLDPKIMKVRGKLTAKTGVLRSEIMLMPIQMRRLAVNAMTREIVGKRLATLLR